MAFKEPAENTGHSIGGLLLVQPLESGAPERCGVSLEDPGRTPHLVLVRVSDERPPLGFLENKCEGIERPG